MKVRKNFTISQSTAEKFVRHLGYTWMDALARAKAEAEGNREAVIAIASKYCDD